jgi:hypothetical protein
MINKILGELTVFRFRLEVNVHIYKVNLKDHFFLKRFAKKGLFFFFWLGNIFENSEHYQNQI